MGAALVGLVWALATAVKRRSEASAAQDEASAKAVVTVLAMVTDLRRDLERETAARTRLQEHVDRLEVALAESQSRAAHLEGQIHVLTLEKQQAQKWATSLATELAELRRALESGHTKLTLPPPAG